LLGSSCTAGAAALPTLLKFSQISKKNWTSEELLPVEIGLGPEYQFHSTFTCPVSKEQASKTNPPVRLTCGHVICRGSIDGLVKSASTKYVCYVHACGRCKVANNNNNNNNNNNTTAADVGADSNARTVPPR
jgi:hypothetical protein